MSIKELAKKYKPYAIKMRREFHMHPEPSMKEVRTSDRIMEELEAMGIPCQKAAGTGVVGIIEGKGPGKTIWIVNTFLYRIYSDILDILNSTGVM